MKTILFIIGILLGAASYRVAFPPSTQLSRCMHLFTDRSAINSNIPGIKEVMAREGIKSLDELIQRRCEYWIGNGQAF